MNRVYANRRFVLSAGILLIGLIYLSRLFYLQIIDDSYVLYAQSNAIRQTTIYPARGLVYDREGELLVYNEAAYDLMVTPGQVKAFDTLLFCTLLSIDKEDLIRRLEKARKYSRFNPSPLITQLTKQEFGYLEEKLYQFPGFFVQPRTLRQYPRPLAAHVLGYVGEISEAQLSKDAYYRMGDYIGISGIEAVYEDILRGRKGSRLVLVDVFNREKGSYAEGKYDTLAHKGADIVLTLDADLQAYGEKLMANKKGSIVAIEPSTGEILALVSSPGYDPNLLVGRIRGQHYQMLLEDTLTPLFNRALMANYSPGSIFKIVDALIGLQNGIITPYTDFPCNKSLVNCHDHPPNNNLTRAIQYSCNPYFYLVYKRLIQPGNFNSVFTDSEAGLEKWHAQVIRMGMGHKLGIDLPSEKPGLIPDVAFYNRWYGPRRWAFSTIYSNGIGQGEVQVVPLQMANLAAIIANRGYYYPPHLLKDVKGMDYPRPQYREKHLSGIDAQHFEVVVEAMRAVTEEAGGTAWRARVPGITVCGKTGTVENPGPDHSGFFAFAPMHQARIAIAVYVENAGFGGTWAAPIASLMIEKYLTDSISDPLKEQRILDFKMVGIAQGNEHTE
jgi:penicillin-binding protein 2